MVRVAGRVLRSEPLLDESRVSGPRAIGWTGHASRRVMSEDNKKLVQRQFDEMWNGDDWTNLEDLFSSRYVNHDPYNPDQGSGPGSFKARVSAYRGVLAGFDLRVEQQIAEGDMVETHWSLRGTHEGELEGTPGTGRQVEVEGQLLSRIENGKFVEEWVHWDTLGLLRQIGAVSTSPS
jgi:steroid delta-isomerase-like uncharacterized protein